MKDVYPMWQSFSKDYGNDIITMRNDLAHCISYNDAGKEVLKVKRKGAGNIILDSEVFKTIRQNIRKYQGLFQKILERLNES